MFKWRAPKRTEGLDPCMWCSRPLPHNSKHEDFCAQDCQQAWYRSMNLERKGRKVMRRWP